MMESRLAMFKGFRINPLQSQESNLRSTTMFYVWQDLGSGLSLEDPFWRSHLHGEGANKDYSTRFEYEHESIYRQVHQNYMLRL